MATLADLSSPTIDLDKSQFEQYDDESGTTSFRELPYYNALRELGYVATASPVGGYWKDQNTLNWFNQNYGTNFSDPLQYMEYLYGPGGSLINDPVHGQLYRTPDGRNANTFINSPLSYDPPETGMTKWAPSIIGGIALAGMGGYLPGTTSIFGGTGAAGAGAYGGEIAGTSAAGEGLGGAAASSGFSLSDPSSWFDLPGGSGVNAGGLDGALGDSAANYAAGMGASNPLTTGGGGSMIDGIIDWVTKNPNLVGQLSGSAINALSSYLSTNAQTDAAKQANETLWNMYNQNRADLAPWRTAGVGALNQLVNLTTPGNQLDTAMLDPGYAFRQAEGQRALDNAARAGGKFYSGGQLKDTAAYNQNYATGEFSNVYNRLAALAGTGQAATNQTGQYGMNAAQGVAGNQTSMGANRASGYMGVGNAITGGISNYLNNMNQQAIIDKLIAEGAFRADGGPVSKGQPYIVGERGPEIVVPQQNGTVVPNEDMPMAPMVPAFPSVANYRGGDNRLRALMERFAGGRR